MEQARRFNSMLQQLGLSRAEAAKTLQVSDRTLHNWLSGHHAVPYAAYKLIRVLRHQEIPFKGWEGWHFSQGQLWTPEGFGFHGKDGSWWSLLVRQARAFNTVYQERNALLRQLNEIAPAHYEFLMQHGRPPPRNSGLRASEAQPSSPVIPRAVLVTPHYRLTGEPNDHLHPGNKQPIQFDQDGTSAEVCPAPGRFAKSRLGRLIPKGGLQ